MSKWHGVAHPPAGKPSGLGMGATHMCSAPALVEQVQCKASLEKPQNFDNSVTKPKVHRALATMFEVWRDKSSAGTNITSVAPRIDARCTIHKGDSEIVYRGILEVLVLRKRITMLLPSLMVRQFACAHSEKQVM